MFMSNSAQQLAHFASKGGRVKRSGSLPGDYVVIGFRKKAFVQPEKFPQEPFDAISGDCITYFFADGYPEPGTSAAGEPVYDQKVPGRNLPSLVGKGKILVPFQQPFVLRQPVGHPPYLVAMPTDRRLRPLARRRLMTSRPFLVDILTRKPWVLLRDTLLG